MNYQQVLALIQQFIVANGNNEITANVLRPILEAILDQPNELIGDLDDLQTTDQTDLVSAINEVLGGVSPTIGSENTKIHSLSLYGIDPDLPELTKIAKAVKLYGPFTCDAGQQMVFKTMSTVGTQENGSVVSRYYRLLRNLTTIGGGGVGQIIPPSWFMPDGEGMYENPEDEGIIAELGDIGNSNVWDVFNLGNAGDPWDMELYRFVRATQNGEIKIWAFQGNERFYGGDDMIVEPDIYEAFEEDFFDITDEPADGGASGIYAGASPTTRTVGGISSGTNIAGKTYDELFEGMLAEYINPSISSFAIAGQSSLVEVGTVISGNKNFSFGFSQSGNVANNTIKIIDVTDGNNVLATGLPKTSPQTVNIGSVAKTTPTDNVWRIEAESTRSATIARNMSIEWVYPLFATTSSITVGTKQPLVSMENANNVVLNLVGESGGNKQFFDIPQDWLDARPLTKIEIFDFNTNAWNSQNQLSTFTAVANTHTVNGNVIDYKRYTNNGSNRGSIRMRLIF